MTRDVAQYNPLGPSHRLCSAGPLVATSADHLIQVIAGTDDKNIHAARHLSWTAFKLADPVSRLQWASRITNACRSTLVMMKISSCMQQ